MNSNLQEWLQENRQKKRAHKRWLRIIGFIAAITMMGTTYSLLLPARTLDNAFCGIEEHTHSVENGCYTEQKALICGKEEAAKSEEEETAEPHVHTDECYKTTSVLTCKAQEHKHSEACYADPNANQDGNIKRENSRELGTFDLTITKKVPNGDKNKLFDFKVKIFALGGNIDPGVIVVKGGPGDEIPYIPSKENCKVYDMVSGNEIKDRAISIDQTTGEVRTQLKDSEKLVITGVPAPHFVEAEEIVDLEDSYDTTVTIDGETRPGTLGFTEAFDDKSIDFVNKSSVSSLTVTKKVSKGDKSKLFPFLVHFTIEEEELLPALKGPLRFYIPKPADCKVYDMISGNEIKDRVISIDQDTGVVRTQLKDSEKLVITGVPLGCDAAAIEEKDPQDPYEAQATINELITNLNVVDVSMGSDQTIDFVNRRAVNSLTVTKKAPGGDKNRLFEFVTSIEKPFIEEPLLKSSGRADAGNKGPTLDIVPNNYIPKKEDCRIYDINSGAEIKNREITISNTGEVKVQLKDSEKLVITGIPVDSTATVEETKDPQDTYDTSVTANGKTEKANVASTILDDDKAIDFVNNRALHTFDLTKAVVEPLPGENEKFAFTVSFEKAGTKHKPVLDDCVVFDKNKAQHKLKDWGGTINGEGVISVRLGDGERLHVKNVPYGYTYTATEVPTQGQKKNYYTTNAINGVFTDGNYVVSRELTGDTTAIFKNLRLRKLSVTKKVSKGDKNKLFDFNVSIFRLEINVKAASGNLRATSNYHIPKLEDCAVYDMNSGALVNRKITIDPKTGEVTTQLKDSEQLVITGIAPEYIIAAKEIPDPRDPYDSTVSVNKGPGGISNYGHAETTGNTGDITMDFDNRRASHELAVTKKVQNGDKNQLFKFNVNIQMPYIPIGPILRSPGPADAGDRGPSEGLPLTSYYPEPEDCKVYDMVSGKEIKDREMTIGLNGDVTVQLKDSEKLVITRIPADSIARVEEVKDPQDAYDATVTANGKTEKANVASTVLNDDKAIGFVNSRRMCSLDVTKKIKDPIAGTNDKFAFAVAITNGNTKHKPVLDDCTVFDKDNKPHKLKDWEGSIDGEGVIFVKLGDKERLHVANVPKGYTQTVTETPVANYKTEYSINGADAVIGNTASSVINDDTADVFTNTRLRTLTVSKEAVGIPSDADRTFEFTVDIANNQKQFIPEDGTFKVCNKDGDEIKDRVKKDANGRLRATLGHSDKLVVTGVPAECTATVEEVADPLFTTTIKPGTGDGEQITGTKWVISMAKDRSAKFVNERRAEDLAVADKANKPQNGKLPSTGDSRTLAFTFGAMLVAVAVAILFYFVKRRKKGQF